MCNQLKANKDDICSVRSTQRNDFISTLEELERERPFDMLMNESFSKMPTRIQNILKSR